jgi:hypothetical protein
MYYTYGQISFIAVHRTQFDYGDNLSIHRCALMCSYPVVAGGTPNEIEPSISLPKE